MPAPATSTVLTTFLTIESTPRRGRYFFGSGVIGVASFFIESSALGAVLLSLGAGGVAVGGGGAGGVFASDGAVVAGGVLGASDGVGVLLQATRVAQAAMSNAYDRFMLLSLLSVSAPTPMSTSLRINAMRTHRTCAQDHVGHVLTARAAFATVCEKSGLRAVARIREVVVNPLNINANPRHARCGMAPALIEAPAASGFTNSTSWESSMLHYAVVFFVIALIAAVFGFGGIAAGAAEIAKILFFIFIIIAAVTFVMSLLRKS